MIADNVAGMILAFLVLCWCAGKGICWRFPAIAFANYPLMGFLDYRMAQFGGYIKELNSGSPAFIGFDDAAFVNMAIGYSELIMPAMLLIFCRSTVAKVYALVLCAKASIWFASAGVLAIHSNLLISFVSYVNDFAVPLEIIILIFYSVSYENPKH